MSQVIASTYEILQEIGAGGGGIVYLGRHLRLGKLVVLKADRRTLTTKMEVLRREVDALKDLSHTYIPQVYDFVVEDGVVYTVMDFIEGESLDKPLERGERFAQAQLVEWSCQLLEALVYLHSRPPHGILHGDIKPSNVMLTPQGDIRLIDFNIALALGEEGAVRVGFSLGYASPEHYGLDYRAAAETQGVDENSATRMPDDPAETMLPSQQSRSVREKRTVMLDARSDIYSLGATLYHLLTGRRPEQDAKEVTPVTRDDGVSPAVAAIIQKAMDPDPDCRYQTAAEMLYDFEHLHENDPRTKRHKRRVRTAAAALTALFLVGGLCSFTGLRQMQQAAQAAEQEARTAEEAERLAKITEQDAKMALEAIHSSELAYQSGDIPSATAWALKALEKDTPYNSQGQKALTDALGVYDLSDGFKPLRTIELPSEPLDVIFSPEGTRLAAIYAYQMAVYDTETGELLAELPTEESALVDAVFLDESRVVYAAPGAAAAYDLSSGTELWSGAAATSIVRSADGSRVAAVYKGAQEAVVYDAATGAVVRNVSFEGRSQRVAANDRFADPKDNLLALNANGTLLAVSFSDGTLDIFDLQDPDGTLQLLDPSGYTHFEGGFNGPYFAFSAAGTSESVFAVIDTQALAQTGSSTSQSPFLVQADETGIYVAVDNALVKVHPVTGEQTELAYASADITGFKVMGNYSLVSAEDNACSVFTSGSLELARTENGYDYNFLQMAGPYLMTGSRDVPSLRLMKLEDHGEADIFAYDPHYAHDEARLSADSSTVMLFRYDALRLYSRDGQLLSETAIPNAEQVYDQQYRRDGEDSRLEVIYNDGTVRAYSAQDGSVLWEKSGEAPDPSLYEEFFTDKLRITSPLHETPAAYDRESGELIRELEKDAYLTYVTQVGEYVITEYVSAQGERFGLLLDENCETLAKLPYLCDIAGDMLVFDYPSGILRQSRIYSLQELTALAEQ